MRIPTWRYQVRRDTHDNPPSELPALDADYREVREFLYQVLTLRAYGISIERPGAVLEVVNKWLGSGECLWYTTALEISFTLGFFNGNWEYWKVIEKCLDLEIGRLKRAGRIAAKPSFGLHYCDEDLGEEPMMLPTDIVLRNDPEFGKWMRRYAEDKEVFFADFARVFGKLIELRIRRDAQGQITNSDNVRDGYHAAPKKSDRPGIPDGSNEEAESLRKENMRFRTWL